MTDPESPLSNSVLGDLQWLCMVTLFIASSITLILYLIQYFYDDLRIQKPEQNNAVSEEADALLGWALSLKSWKSQWRVAWCRALNDESRKSGSPVQLTFEEESLQSSELVVGQVSSFKKSAGQKAAQCKVVGDKLQFSLSALPSAMSPGEPCRYSVKISALELQLDLQIREAEGEVWMAWGVSHLETWDLQLSPSFTQDNATGPSVAAVKDVLRQLLCAAHPSVMLSCRPAQATEVKEACKQVTSPPKPPRAHDWKLLVKNIRVTCKEQEDGAAGSMNPLCVLQLDDPPQKLSTSVLQNTASPAWDQPFIFELNGRSKELNIQLLDDGKPQENSLMGQVSVPFHLVKKQPKGQQTFALISKDQVTGSLTAEFTYLEPSEVRSWQPPTPALTKRVEMDRTVMPCGTVVTTITAVKSKPARPLLPGLSKNPTQQTPMKPPSGTKSKLSSRRVSEQPSMLGTMGSKALSSSDTELLMLNGSDPVAEAAIRQLHESAKQKLKSPVKKSTIIISGVAKTPLSQDDEMALMVGYAAAMDASMSEQGSQEISVATASVVGASSNLPEAWSEPQEGPSGVVQAQAQQAPEDWESQAEEDIDRDADKTSMSICISESGSKKSREDTIANQKCFPEEKRLPSKECQAVLPPAPPVQGPGYEPVAQRPGVPGATCDGGPRETHSHIQPDVEPQAAAQEQEQSQRLHNPDIHSHPGGTTPSLTLPPIVLEPPTSPLTPSLVLQPPTPPLLPPLIPSLVLQPPTPTPLPPTSSPHLVLQHPTPPPLPPASSPPLVLQPPTPTPLPPASSPPLVLQPSTPTPLPPASYPPLVLQPPLHHPYHLLLPLL
uniref:C2 domain-containing protein 2-like isoform X1 n=1 Tax=Oncorhynchus gorbuscha TaxID=8017 RepID=UPI001EAF1BBC|nr:C2 domain-containing protein 2-like isoform X1 [Oncorhynchus gorbuscha]